MCCKYLSIFYRKCNFDSPISATTRRGKPVPPEGGTGQLGEHRSPRGMKLSLADEAAADGENQLNDAETEGADDGGEEGSDDADHGGVLSKDCGAPDGFALKLDVTPTPWGTKHVHGKFPPNR